MRLAGGDYRTTDDGARHETGRRIAVIPIPTVVATAVVVVLDVGYRIRAGVLHLSGRGLPGRLVLARRTLALGLILAGRALPLGLGFLAPLLILTGCALPLGLGVLASLLRGSAGLAGLPSSLACSSLRLCAGTLPSAGGKPPARRTSFTGEAATSFCCRAATAPALRIRLVHEAQHEDAGDQGHADTTR